MRKQLSALFMLPMLSLLNGCANTTMQETTETSSTTTTQYGTPKKDDGKFMQLHRSFIQRGKEGPVGLLFLGDSITAGWATKAPNLWRQFYDRYQPANFGIGGDHAEHVLWRIEHGELDHIKPKVIVLLIGTNNTISHTVAQTSTYTRQIIEVIQQKLPQTKVLLMGVFPRAARKNADGTFDDGIKRMQVITLLNAELAKLDDGKRVRFLDIGQRFLVDGKIPHDVMPDQLHPALPGYKIWAESMQPLLEEMLSQP